MSRPGLDQHARELVVRLAQAGKTTRQIAADLERATGVRRDHSTISRLLKTTAQSQTNPGKALVRETFAQTLPVVLDDVERQRSASARIVARLADQIEALQALGRRTAAQEKELARATMAHSRMATRLATFSELAIRHSGAADPDPQPETEAAASRVLERIETMVAQHEARPRCATCGAPSRAATAPEGASS